jgi:Tol biopolymer transport system component
VSGYRPGVPARIVAAILLVVLRAAPAMPLPEPGAPTDDGGSVLGNEAVDLTPDGRFLLFGAYGTGPNHYGLRLRDIQAGGTDPVAIWNDGRPAHPYAGNASVSDDGRYVAFTVLEDGFDPDDHDGQYDLFLRDRLLQTTRRVERPAGVEWWSAELSGNGARVMYEDISGLTGTVGGFDLGTGAVRRMSVSAKDGLPRSAWSPEVSTDGRFTVFTSKELETGDPAEIWRGYRYDWDTGALSNICRDGLGIPAEDSCFPAGASHNGRFVLFRANSGEFGYPEVRGNERLFLKDLETGVVDAVDRTPYGDFPQFGNPGPIAHVSDDGRFVVFAHSAWLYYGSGQNYPTLYVRDLQESRTTVLSPIPPLESSYFWRSAAMAADGHTIVANGPSGDGGSPNAYLFPAPPLVRVDLRVGLTQRTDWPRAVDVRVTNAGVTRATLANIRISSGKVEEIYTEDMPCAPYETGKYRHWGLPLDCNHYEILPGAAVTFTVEPLEESGSLDLRVQARTNEGDSHPADNDVTLQYTAPDPVLVSTQSAPAGGSPGQRLLVTLGLVALIRRYFRRSSAGWHCEAG